MPLDDKQELQKASFENEKKVLLKLLNSRLKQAVKRKNNCLKQLDACLGWETVHHEAVLLQSQLYLLKRGMREVEIPDWENENGAHRIILDPQKLPGEEIKNRFQRSRKLRAGIVHWQRQLEEAEKDLHIIQDRLSGLISITSLEDLMSFQESLGLTKKTQGEIKKTPAKLLPYREFYSESGMQIWVGKSAKNNEVLTFRLGRGSDWWLHVRDFSGSHVILRRKGQHEPDQESLKDAAQLALYYSKAKEQGEGEVCITQCKYLSRLGKNRTGAVQIANHRVVRVRHDIERLKRLGIVKT